MNAPNALASRIVTIVLLAALSAVAIKWACLLYENRLLLSKLAELGITQWEIWGLRIVRNLLEVL